jgi:hypothetical protein
VRSPIIRSMTTPANPIGKPILGVPDPKLRVRLLEEDASNERDPKTETKRAGFNDGLIDSFEVARLSPEEQEALNVSLTPDPAPPRVSKPAGLHIEATGSLPVKKVDFPVSAWGWKGSKTHDRELKIGFDVVKLSNVKTISNLSVQAVMHRPMLERTEGGVAHKPKVFDETLPELKSEDIKKQYYYVENGNIALQFYPGRYLDTLEVNPNTGKIKLRFSDDGGLKNATLRLRGRRELQGVVTSFGSDQKPAPAAEAKSSVAPETDTARDPWAVGS